MYVMDIIAVLSNARIQVSNIATESDIGILIEVWEEITGKTVQCSKTKINKL